MNRRFVTMVFAAMVLVAPVCLAGAPDQPVSLIENDSLSALPLQQHQGAKGERSVVDVEHPKFDKAVRFQTIDTPRARWTFKVDVPVDENKLRQGDTLFVEFWLRTIATDDESGDGTVMVALASRKPRWTTARIFTAGAGKQWRHWQMPIAMHRLKGQNWILSMQFAGLPQTVEVANLRLVNYGPDVDPAKLPMTRMTYEGREPDAKWRKDALARIEKIRKSDLTIKVVDADGNPVPNATVKVKQQRHAFGFGSVMNNSVWTMDPADQQRYLDIFKANFNVAPLEGGLRWQNFFKPSPERFKEQWGRTTRTIDWLRENEIKVRGHYLMWGPLAGRTQPEELLKKPNELITAHRAHMKKKIEMTKGRIDEWDTINHIAAWGRKWNDLPGGNEVYADTIKLARKLAPDAEHWINEGQIVVADGNRMDDYEKIIRDLIKMDAKPDGIGFMAHFRDTLLPHPQEVYKRIDRFAQFGTKLQYTELDVEAGSDEQLQADYMRDVMIAGFSHSSMKGIVLWGFWEGRHWRPDAALWRKDWTIKPAGQVWRDWVFDKWWTNQTVRTNAQGVAQVRAFHGTHTVRVGDVEKTVTIDADGESVAVSLGAD